MTPLHAMASEASQATALRVRVGELEAFVREFLDPEGYGLAVNSEIRNHARRLLGKKEREQ